MDFEVGDLVYSTAGRDKARCYVVLWIDGLYLGICDGDLHKADKIKKKKYKHVSKTGLNSEFVRLRLAEGIKVTNAEIRRAVAEFVISKESTESALES